MKNNIVVGHGFLSDSLYKLILDYGFKNNLLTLHDDIDIKHCIINENSSMLWHRRLGHISKEKITRLVKDGVLHTLDFADFGTCVDCIKGKQTNMSLKLPRGVQKLLRSYTQIFVDLLPHLSE